MYESVNSSSKSEVYRTALHNRLLMYGFVMSIVGLPIGIFLNLPVVWGLAVLGIVVGSIKFALQ
jgi:hypothetical protein